MKKSIAQMARFGALALIMALSFSVLSPRAGAANVDVSATISPQVNVVVDGVAQSFYNVKGQEVHPLTYNGSNYLPVRAIGELMNKVVGWDQATLTLTISGIRGGDKVVGTPDNRATSSIVTAQLRQDFTILVDGTARNFTDATGTRIYPLLYNGSTYLPLRAVGELMGSTVKWDGATSTVTLQTSATQNRLVTDADQFGTGVTQTDSSAYIGEAKAKEIALKHAGLAANQVTFVQARLEREDGGWEYDVEFYTKDNKEYDYEINAYTGAILSFDYDADHYVRPSNSATNSAAGYIGEAKAKSLALSHVGLAESAIYGYSCSLDRDGNVVKYEVDFKSGSYEYEVDIDAVSGKVLKYEKDWD